MSEIICPHCGETTTGLPDRVSFWYMNDNHSFTPLHGADLFGIVEAADQQRKTDRGKDGMLCPAMLFKGAKEIRRVGPWVHDQSFHEDNDGQWRKKTSDWMNTLSEDNDIQRLVLAGGAK